MNSLFIDHCNKEKVKLHKIKMKFILDVIVLNNIESSEMQR